MEKAGAGGYPLTYAYDAVGNLTSMTDANSHTTRWTYTARNQVDTKTYADNSVYHYGYDNAGRMTSRKDALNRTTGYAYNAYSLPTAIDYPSDADVAVTYDQQGRRLSMTDGSGATTWTYDALGRPSTEAQGRSGRTLHYTYDNESHRIGMEITVAAASWQTTYGYDNAGRLHTVLDDRLPAGQPFTYTFADNANLVAQVLSPTGLKTTKSYDTLGRLTAISSLNAQLSVLDSFAYTYDAAGQRQQETALDRTRTFSYDAWRQLSQSVTAVNGAESGRDTFAFDGIGNRTTSSSAFGSTPGTTTYTANSVNQYIAVTGAVVDSPAFDADGNTTSLRGKTLRYDEENRLIEVSDATRTVDYVYDGLGRRVERKDTPASGTATVTHYVYDGMRVVEELDGTGNSLRSYTRGLDIDGTLGGAGGIGGLLAMVTPNAGTWTAANYCYDGNGNVTDLLDDAGNVVAHYVYSPFGDRVSATGALADINPYQFSSKERDLFSGLYHYGYRSYDPTLGRWLSRDPIAETGGALLHGFVSNDPLNAIDALGLFDYWHQVRQNLLSEFRGLLRGAERVDEFIIRFDLHPIDTTRDMISNAFKGIKALGELSNASIDKFNQWWAKALLGYDYRIPCESQRVWDAFKNRLSNFSFEDYGDLAFNLLLGQAGAEAFEALEAARAAQAAENITNTKVLQFADGAWFEDVAAYRELKADISKNGLTNKLIEYTEIDGSKYVLRGNGRLQVAEDLKITDQLQFKKVDLPFQGYRTSADVLEEANRIIYNTPRGP